MCCTLPWQNKTNQILEDTKILVLDICLDEMEEGTYGNHFLSVLWPKCKHATHFFLLSFPLHHHHFNVTLFWNLALIYHKMGGHYIYILGWNSREEDTTCSCKIYTSKKRKILPLRSNNFISLEYFTRTKFEVCVRNFS